MLLIVFLRTILLYALVVIGMRVMGKRQLGELQPSELVITILISNITTLPIEDTNVPLLAGAVPVLTLICFEVFLSFLTMKSLNFRKFICGSPRIIIHNGVINQKELYNLRYSIDDLMEQLRQNSIFDIEEVEMAVVETTGQLSVCKKSEKQTVTLEFLNKNIPKTQIPAVVISDGKIVEQVLQYCQISAEHLQKIVQKNGHNVEDIFLMTSTPDHKFFIVPKSK